MRRMLTRQIRRILGSKVSGKCRVSILITSHSFHGPRYLGFWGLLGFLHTPEWLFRQFGGCGSRGSEAFIQLPDLGPIRGCQRCKGHGFVAKPSKKFFFLKSFFFTR